MRAREKNRDRGEDHPSPVHTARDFISSLDRDPWLRHLRDFIDPAEASELDAMRAAPNHDRVKQILSNANDRLTRAAGLPEPAEP